jgi:hypothetical protein
MNGNNSLLLCHFHGSFGKFSSVSASKSPLLTASWLSDETLIAPWSDDADTPIDILAAVRLLSSIATANA